MIFDYTLSGSRMTLLSRLAVALVNRRLKRIGEPWITFFLPELLESRLRACGFRDIRDYSGGELNARYFSARTDRVRVSPAGRVMIASV